MATSHQRVFLPFGEFLPDRRQLSNEGLLRAFGVTPLGEHYVRAPGCAFPGGGGNPGVSQVADPLTEGFPYGFGLHSSVVSGARKLYGYYGTASKLVEMDISAMPAFNETDRSRLAGGAYAFSATPPLDAELWWFTSYGNNMIATNFTDEVQVLSTPGSGNFVDLFTSTWKPQARFVFPIRQNLFLAYVFSPTNYETVTSGTHPQLVAWAMNDTPQSIGSKNVDPAFIGAGYNPLNNDFGPITAAIGGDFGLVFQVGGIVRIDGPPYEFRAIVQGDSTLYPYSVFRLGDDIYFWGNAGPSVLRGGEAPVERLGLDKIHRSLLDNVTSFGADFARAVDLPTREVSGASDSVNNLQRWSYLPVDSPGAASDFPEATPTLLLDHDDSKRRFTVSRSSGGNVFRTVKDLFLRRAPLPAVGSPWGPFGDVFGLKLAELTTGDEVYLFRYQLDENFILTHPNILIQTGFGKLHDSKATRITAVRPIWTSGDVPVVSAVSVSVHTKNKSYEVETTSGPFTVMDDNGWIGTYEAVVGSYHSVTFVYDATQAFNSDKIHEIEGIEIQYVEGGDYGA